MSREIIIADGNAQSAADQSQHHLPGRRAAALRRGRSHEGQDPRRSRSSEVFGTLQTYLGLGLRERLQPFGRTWQVTLQADHRFRVKPDDIARSRCATPTATWCRSAPWSRGRRTILGPQTHHPLQPLPFGIDHRRSGRGLQLGPGASLMEQMADQPSCRSRWASSGPACPTRRSRSAREAIVVFALAIVLVFLVLAASVRELDGAGRGDPRRARSASWAPCCAVADARTSRTTSTCRSASCCSSPWRARTRS